jgi:DNA-binding beta-propeller fold protein YncE
MSSAATHSAVSSEEGTPPYSYDFDSAWGDLPSGWALGDVAAVGIDSDDNVYLFNRGEHPMIVLDRQGAFLRSWGKGVFTRPHGLHIAADGFAYCTDDGDHTVRKCTLDGEVVMTLGVPSAPSGFMSGAPFCRCTHTALSPDGEIYVSDGYGNACVHVFAEDGTLLHTWGRSGTGPGEFYVPHNICCDPSGWVYVADRENSRIQIFDGGGRFESEWNTVYRPCGLFLTATPEVRVYVGELGPVFRSATPYPPNIGARIKVLDAEGAVLSNVGAATMGTGTKQFVCPHGIAADSRGDLYVGETSHTAWPMVFPDEPIPDGLPTLRKLVLRGVSR